MQSTHLQTKTPVAILSPLFTSNVNAILFHFLEMIPPPPPPSTFSCNHKRGAVQQTTQHHCRAFSLLSCFANLLHNMSPWHLCTKTLSPCQQPQHVGDTDVPYRIPSPWNNKPLCYWNKAASFSYGAPCREAQPRL